MTSFQKENDSAFGGADAGVWNDHLQATTYPDENVLDLTYLDLDTSTLEDNFTNSSTNSGCQKRVLSMMLQHNQLDYLPKNIHKFCNLKHLDLSNNLFSEVPDSILQLISLKSFSARANELNVNSFPKNFGQLASLEVLNLSGNNFTTIPSQILELTQLRALYMGGNIIEELPCEIWKLERLEVLYLGGNRLTEIPAEMGKLQHLQSLVLCENRLENLPSTISSLKRLRSLALHKNLLTTLPPSIVTLQGLVELSLRDNPLVVRFVRDMMYDPPTLRELAARTVKTYKIPYCEGDLPSTLVSYLSSACRCVNPKCKGVYFDARVEHIRFVDFCGKYRLPLLQYLCSPNCTSQPNISYGCSSSDSDSADSDMEVPASKLKRVLLG